MNIKAVVLLTAGACALSQIAEGAVWKDTKGGQVLPCLPILRNPDSKSPDAEDHFRVVIPSASDPTIAFDTKTKRNFSRDECCTWRDTKTGEKLVSFPILRNPDSKSPDAEDHFRVVIPSASDPAAAFDPKSKRNFFREDCTPAKSSPPKTTGDHSMAPSGQSRPFEAGVGYSFIHADEDTDKFNLNGGYVSLKFNINETVGVVAEASGAYGKKEDVHLDRYLLLVGPEFSLPVGSGVTLFADVLAGVDRDKIKVSEFSQSNNAFAAAIGGGASYEIMDGVSIRAQADYLPTRFSGKWQSSYRFMSGVGVGFGGS